MKWAYLKIPDLCLPEATAYGEARELLIVCDKAKPTTE